MDRPKLATNCGSFSPDGFKEHIAECGGFDVGACVYVVGFIAGECAPCWDDAQARGDLDFDPSTIANPDRKHKQETVCACSDCQRTGALMLRSDYLELSINQIEGLKKHHDNPRLKNKT